MGSSAPPMDAFVADRIVSVDRSQRGLPPDLAVCRRVEEVAAPSIAAHVGLKRGDILESINGHPAIEIDLWRASVVFDRHEYVFYRPDGQERTLLVTSGAPLGVSLGKTNEAITAQIARAAGEPRDLRSIWERGDWRLLAKVSRMFRDVGRKRTDRLFKRFAPASGDEPSILLLGAALYEQGRRSKGLNYMRRFEEDFARHWTLDYAAIVDYYHAREKLHEGRTEEALQQLHAAYALSPLPRIAEKIRELGEEPDTELAWLGEDFPVDYRLPILDGDASPREPVSLSATLQTLTEKQVLVVCLLSSYRGNGPYNLFMKRYSAYATHFREYVAGLHVITMNPERNPDSPWWNEAEDRAREDGIPFFVLHDRDQETTAAVRPSRSPLILLLDRGGQIVYEGELETDVEMWDIMAGVEAAEPVVA